MLQWIVLCRPDMVPPLYELDAPPSSLLNYSLRSTWKVAAEDRSTAVFLVSRRVSSERVSVNSAVTAYSPARVRSPVGKP